MRLKIIAASASILALLSGCSTNGHHSEPSNFKQSHSSEIPTNVSIGSEVAESYFLFEVNSDILPDKKFIIHADDFTKKQSFSLCPQTPQYNCDSYVQIQNLSMFDGKVQVDFSIRYLDSMKEIPYESGPEERLHYAHKSRFHLLEIGKRIKLGETTTHDGELLDSLYVTYEVE
ncbi:hypothetical protein ACR0ST_04440 [Aliidiomarina sp. Khilg15.8]